MKNNKSTKREQAPKLWTPPTAANIAPLAEQLTALSADAPRFVVIEKGYGTYKEQGYAVYDRKEQKVTRADHSPYTTWNDVHQERAHAEEEAATCNAQAPKEIEVDMGILGILVETEKDWENRFETPLPEPTPPQAEEETVFVSDEPRQVGDEITDRYGHIYVAIEASWYLSERDIADLEDQDVLGAAVGWQTKAKLKG
jgi:hypothetical protein